VTRFVGTSPSKRDRIAKAWSRQNSARTNAAKNPATDTRMAILGTLPKEAA
jgi:hypothetical protein